ncbi:MAG: MarC family protein [Candidatus Thermoplasmatota archaeon]|jgi:multiple antibiotic resistance protein|uniref:MarC family protein n=1 Tax=Ferroplasma sp. TaxID=2591003 RepID=UPI00261061E9|nr:MarC family protein [Ferroplasma sp.]MCL4311762.1 MarC family protein [Candidatus Thermoplasmatota archaeon]
MAILILFLTVFVALFAIINPIGAVPILITLTDGYSLKERREVIRRSVYMASGMLFGFMFLGVYIFDILGISIYDFEIAGGILLFKVGFDMLQGKTSQTKITNAEQQDSADREAIAIAPIGTPLLAGPGSITTAIIYFNGTGIAIFSRMVVVLAVILVLILSFIILRYSLVIFQRIGKTGSIVISRIMGLLLTAIAVDLITTGIIHIFL